MRYNVPVIIRTRGGSLASLATTVTFSIAPAKIKELLKIDIAPGVVVAEVPCFSNVFAMFRTMLGVEPIATYTQCVLSTKTKKLSELRGMSACVTIHCFRAASVFVWFMTAFIATVRFPVPKVYEARKQNFTKLWAIVMSKSRLPWGPIDKTDWPRRMGNLKSTVAQPKGTWQPSEHLIILM